MSEIVPGNAEAPGNAAEIDAVGPFAASPAGAAPDADGAGGARDGSDGSIAGEQLEAWDPERLRAAVEAILFVSDAPLTAVAIAAGLSVPLEDVTGALGALSVGYDERGAGIELREVAGGVRLFTREDAAPAVERFLRDGQRSRLTQAALETVAVIAYRQPVTRARISAIRGVSVDGVIRTLLSRGLIVETGSDPETGGILYGTTELFLEKMGLRSLEELPSLAPLLPEIDAVDTDST